MRRIHLLLPLALLVLAAGCGQKQSQSAVETTTVKVASAAKQTKAQKPAAAAKIAGDDDAQVTKRLNVLQAYTEKQIPGVKFPAFTPFAARDGINAAAKGDVGDYTVYFSTSSQELTPNAAPLALHKQTPTSTAEADDAYAAMAYQPVAKGQGQTGLTGDVRALLRTDAKGTSLIWDQGKYSLTVRAAAHETAAAKTFAEKIEAIVAQNPLPKTETHGAIALNLEKHSGRLNTVSWREGSAYYTISGQDAMATLKLAIAVS
ncbi:hypothetical protein [Lacticaseibacillus hegangensis]|uniref:Lipoprotein n=1 Tax=Lacticaseibacillus hegangensis TaxID=2486010 RepID=A0ABW4CRE0_9LACO|nr:hypothetical protein [Lacticaseibacillus hegangensis]